MQNVALFSKTNLVFKLPVLVTSASVSPGSCSYFGACMSLNLTQEQSIKVPFALMAEYGFSV